jgi:enoyl-[acyl-carrier protein] reductase II
VVEGDVVNGTLMAGQIAGLVKEEASCADIINNIISQAKSFLKINE